MLKVLNLIFRVLSAILNGLFMILYRTLQLFVKQFKFSMGFKINFLYILLYLALFYLLYGINILFIQYALESPSDSLSTTLLQYKQFLPAILTPLLIVFGFLGHKIVTKLLYPIKEMTQRVQSIDGDSLQRLDTNRSKDELKDLAVTFNAMLDRLELYVTQQKQFVSDASHELRTPVAIIQGYTDMLQRWGRNDPQILDESITSLAEETANMKNLLEKLLFLSRSDKNTLTVQSELFDLSSLCHKVIKETSFIDDEHELISKINDEIMLYGDASLIKELIRILMDNAIKYTPEGGTITLSCVYTKQNIILSIKDTGIGIPSEAIPHLFERFYRVDEARNKNTGGTGLGLAIAREISDLHEAKLSVTSKLGEGTEFLIFFSSSHPSLSIQKNKE